MCKVGILIAVENYVDRRIPSVDYAEADAMALADAFKQHGFDPADQLLLINNKATKASIESRVKKILSSMVNDDILYFYYAGHGFARNGRNYITCNDTILDDLENTSIPVEWLFEQFKSSDCKKIVMFLDSCESGMLATAKVRGIYSDLTEDELEEFFDNAEHCVCFAACKPGQYSHPSDKLKHGIWTYHVIEAFNANAELALEKGHLLTSSSLQNYLKKEVPRTLRTTYADTRVQTPWFYGAQTSDFLVANVASILEKRKIAANPNIKQLLNIRLYEEHGLQVRRLSGFRKTHRVPDRVNDSTQAFVAKIAKDDLNEDLEKVVKRLRDVFGFKRTDIQTDGPTDGGGSVITPYFDYEVSVSLNPKDPSEAIWLHQVVNIRKPDQILTEEFDKVFEGTFDTLEFSTGKTINIAGVIDQIENLEDERITVDYDKDLTRCIIRLKGINSAIILNRETFSLVQEGGHSTKDLIDSFFKVQKILINTHQLKQLPFKDLMR
jgi:hypothetical protein